MKIPSLIARDRECEALQRCLESDRSEFVIICGRRRVGKTFLVDQFFKGKYDFSFTGGHKVPTRVQLRNFAKALKRYGHRPQSGGFKDWYEAFDSLEEYLEGLPADRKKVIFIDEMPWIDTTKSDFVSALENFWNGWANHRYDIILIATGSATSWMADNLIDNQGGLHNRLTARLFLKPFTLKETEEYLRTRKIRWNRYQILQTYMLTGGVPFYLSQLKEKLSIAQNIDELCFSENGELRNEFDELYNALFSKSENYVEIVRLLFRHKDGLSRKEISETVTFNGSRLTRMLKNLEQCNFIAKRSQFGNPSETIYRLVDFYTLFYFNFLEHDHSLNEHWWTNHMNEPSILSWQGRTFELIGLLHHEQIKRSLSIAGIPTEVFTWRQVPNKAENIPGAQVDMVIQRSDQTIHLCEMKFSVSQFKMTTAYAERLRKRREIFQEATKTTHTILHTFITTYGLSNPQDWDIVHSEVTMDDLFKT